MKPEFERPRKRGRPATGLGEPVQVRMQPDRLKALDAWRASQPDLPTRPEAVRRLVAMMFAAGGNIDRSYPVEAIANSSADDMTEPGGEPFSLSGFALGTGADDTVVAKLNLTTHAPTKRGKVVRISMSRATGSKLAGQLELLTKTPHSFPSDNLD